MHEVRARPGAALALGALVVLLLVGYSTNLAAGFWSPRAAVLLVATAIGLPLVGRLVVHDQPLRPVAWAAAAFAVWAAVSAVASSNHVVAVFGLYNQGTGLLFVTA